MNEKIYKNISKKKPYMTKKGKTIVQLIPMTKPFVVSTNHHYPHYIAVYFTSYI